MSNQNITISLYGGKHTGVFTAGNHRYKIDGQYKKGVTTILGATLAKPALMLWPLNECLKSLGATFNEGDKSWMIPLDKLIITAEDLNKAAKAHTVKKDKGADVGTQVHELAETFLRAYKRGDKQIQAVINKDTQKPYKAFTDWFTSLGEDVEVVDVERVVYSEVFDFAGTFDFILKINGKVYLCDLKTSNASRSAPDGVYPEAFAQLGAYYEAYQEERAYVWGLGAGERASELQRAMPAIDDLMIVSCRKDGKLSTKTASEVGLVNDDCKRLWEDIFKVNRLMTGLKERLGSK